MAVRNRARRRLVRVGVWLIALVTIAFGLRWLNVDLWNYGEAARLPARSTVLATDDAPTTETNLGDGLTLTEFANAEYGTPLRVFHRSDEEQVRPTLFLIDSLAWRDRSDDGLMFWAEGWARHGFTVVTVTHRPVDIEAFPGPAEDVMAGVEFALGLGVDYDVDPSRVALLGASAGGHLAAYVGYRAAEVIDGIEVRAVVNAYGPTDFRYIADDKLGHSWYRIPTLLFTPELDAAEDVNLLLDCNLLRRSCRDPIVQASPITYVTPAAAPTMIVQGKRDGSNPWRQAPRLAEALLEAGVEVELILDPEMGHNLDPKYLEPITEFLDSHLIAGGGSSTG